MIVHDLPIGNGSGRLVSFVDVDDEGQDTVIYSQVMCGAGVWSNDEAKSDYEFAFRLARLIEAIGIDNSADVDKFVSWWADHGAACQRAFAGYCRGGENDYTFAEWVRDAFLDFIEPMSEADLEDQWEYNERYKQEWLVMGEERSAVVKLDFTEVHDCGLNDEPHKFIYTAGDYPTFKRFCYLGWANMEVVKWTGR